MIDSLDQGISMQIIDGRASFDVALQLNLLHVPSSWFEASLNWIWIIEYHCTPGTLAHL